MVVGAGGGQPAGLLKDVPELLQEAVQEGLGRRCEGRPDGWLGAPRRAHAQPCDALATADEGQAVVRKVPQDGLESAEVVIAEDEVEGAQRDAETADGERLGVDRDRHVVSDTLAWDPVAVGHKHLQRRTGVRGKLEASTEFDVDEIGRRAGVEEGD
jgi:hypothetical protein